MKTLEWERNGSTLYSVFGRWWRHETNVTGRTFIMAEDQPNHTSAPDAAKTLTLIRVETKMSRSNASEFSTTTWTVFEAEFRGTSRSMPLFSSSSDEPLNSNIQG